MEEEEDYSNEEYVEQISRDDLDIIENTNEWEPTDEEIEAYASKIGVEISDEHEYIIDIIVKHMKMPLPIGWARAFHKDTKVLYYINDKENKIELHTDIEDIVFDEIKEAYELHELSKMNQQKKGKNENISNKQSNNKKEASIKHKRKKQYINQSNDEQDNDHNDEDEGIEKAINAKKKKHRIEYEEFLEFSGQDSQDKQKEITIEEIHYNRNIKPTPSLSSSPLNHHVIEKEDELILKKRHLSNDSNATLTQQKQDYRNQKKEELKAYCRSLKANYKNDYEEIKDQAFQNYEKALISKKRELRDQINQSNVGKLSQYEQNLKTTKETELDSYSQILNQSKQSPLPEEDFAKTLNELVLQKQNLITDIDKRKSVLKNLKTQMEDRVKARIDRSRKHIEDNQKNKKEVMQKKYQSDIDNLSRGYETKLQNNKSLFNQSFRKQKSKKMAKEFAMTSIQPILTSFQSTLNEEFKSQSKKIEEDFERHKQSDIDDFNDAMQKETFEKIEMINRDSQLLEEQYYEELNKIRSEATIFNNKRRDEIKEFLAGLSSSFNSMKTLINNQLNKQLKNILIALNQTIVSSKQDEAIAVLESKCEEQIMFRASEAQIAYQKSKSMFELTEKEYVQKEKILRYFISICRMVTQKMIENPMIDDDKFKIEFLIDEILSSGKLILSEFKVKYRMNYNKRLFSFLEIYIESVDRVINNQVHRDGRLNASSSNRFSSGLFYNDFNLNKPVTVDIPSYRYHEVKSDRKDIELSMSRTSIENKEDGYNYHNKRIQVNTQPLQSQSRVKKESTEFISLPKSKSKSKELDQELQLSNYYLNEANQYNQHQHQKQYLNQDPTFSLPNDIVSSFPGEEFNLYSRIIDFLMDEKVSLDKDYLILNEQMNMNNQLMQMNKSGYLDKYNQVFLEESIKTNRIEQRYQNKHNLFLMIKSNISEVFNFIISNRHRKDIFIEKLRLLMKHINDYNKYVYQSKKELNSGNSKASRENSSSMLNKTAYKTSREIDLKNLRSINRFSLSIAMNERNNTIK